MSPPDTTCIASTHAEDVYNIRDIKRDYFTCRNVLSNSNNFNNFSWARGNWTEDPYPWISINFGRFYAVEKIQLKHRPADLNGNQGLYMKEIIHDRELLHMFKEISLEFSDGTKVDHTLSSNPNWNDVDLSRPVVTVFVKITGKSVYVQPWWKDFSDKNAIHHGFSNIRVFGCSAGEP